jgi:hypothetical protein
MIMTFCPQSMTLDTAKRMGTRLRQAIQAMLPEQALSRTQALELVAVTLGFDHWHEAQKALASEKSSPKPVSPPCASDKDQVIVKRAGQLIPIAMADLQEGDRLYVADVFEKVTRIMFPHVSNNIMEQRQNQVMLPACLTYADLAQRLGIKASTLIKHRFYQGVMVTVNQPLTQGQAAAIVRDHNKIPVDAQTGQPIELGRPEDQVFRPAFERWWLGRQPPGTAKPTYDHDRWAYVDASVHQAFEGYLEGQRQLLATLRPQWEEAYAAFVGAFDTPAEQLKRNDAYSQDACKRLRAVNALFQPSS